MTPLTDEEVSALLALDVVAHLSTLDGDGFPVVIAVWFLWDNGTFHFASDTQRDHVARVMRNSRAAVVVDTEAELRPDGERPNQQVRAVGRAIVEPDIDGAWSARIWEKYGGDPAQTGSRLAGRDRSVIHLVPSSIVAVAGDASLSSIRRVIPAFETRRRGTPTSSQQTTRSKHEPSKISWTQGSCTSQRPQRSFRERYLW